MTIDLIVSLALFSLSITLQPGPNNALFMAQGLAFGFARTLPSILGLTAAFAGLLVCCGFGLAALFMAFPVLHTAMKVLSILYLLYIAWRVATAAPRPEAEGGAPLSFVEGFTTLCISPQAWVFAASFVTAYLAPERFIGTLGAILAVCVPARFVGGAVWAMSGYALRPLLRSRRAVRTFNLAMAVVMVASLWPLAAEAWRELGI